jgi:ATP-dependent protease ClpP protease subunit
MGNEKIIYINFFDSIDPIKVNKFIQFTTEIIDLHEPSELYFFIASNGGDVDSGFVLYNFLVSLQSKLSVTMHNTGTIDSIANVVFAAGQNRYAAPNSSFLFHGVSINMQGGVSRTILKESLSRLEGMENRIAHTVSRHSKLTEFELTSLFNQGEGKDVQFALSKEIIQEIKLPTVPKGAIHLAMNFL